MQNQDLFKAYQQGIKETQKNQLNNTLSPAWERVRVRGGLAADTDNTSSDDDGGGIFNSGTLTITKSTISSNSTFRPGSSSGDGATSGGGISNFGTATIINSTISGNSTRGNEAGGGGIRHFGGLMTIINSTISGNTTDGGGTAQGGGIYFESGLSIKNSIISGNTLTDGSLNNCYSTAASLTDLGNNLSDGGCFYSGDPSFPTNFDSDNCLGPLADNGGLTHTIALIPSGENGCMTNLAIDGVPNDECEDEGDPANDIEEDQRGIPRPQTVSCDIGAFELIDQNNNGVDDCLELGEFGDEDGNGIADTCDALISPEDLVTPAPTINQWGMIAFGFISGIFGIGFLRKRKLDPETSSG